MVVHSPRRRLAGPVNDYIRLVILSDLVNVRCVPGVVQRLALSPNSVRSSASCRSSVKCPFVGRRTSGRWTAYQISLLRNHSIPLRITGFGTHRPRTPWRLSGGSSWSPADRHDVSADAGERRFRLD